MAPRKGDRAATAVGKGAFLAMFLSAGLSACKKGFRMPNACKPFRRMSALTPLRPNACMLSRRTGAPTPLKMNALT